MTTNFPAALDTADSLYAVTDAVDNVLAAHHNNLKDAVIASETKIGYGADTPTVGEFLVGNTDAGTSQWRTLLTTDIPDISAIYVPKSLYDANSVLYATSDNTPVALTVGASTLVGRKATGDIVALTAAEVRTIINVENGADVTDATNVDAAGAAMMQTAWTQYYPTPSQTGGTTPTYTNTQTGKYCQFGKTCFMQFILINTSGGTAGDGAVTLYFSLPVNALATESTDWVIPQGHVIVYNGAATAFCQCIITDATHFKIVDTGTAALTAVGQNNAVRIIQGFLFYETA